MKQELSESCHLPDNLGLHSKRTSSEYESRYFVAKLKQPFG